MLRMRLSASLVALALLAGCGGGDTAAVQNEAVRVSGDLERRAQQITDTADKVAAASARQLEAEGAAVFANRGNPFNENEAAAPDVEAEIEGEGEAKR
jgi:hypothetical protein